MYSFLPMTFFPNDGFGQGGFKETPQVIKLQFLKICNLQGPPTVIHNADRKNTRRPVLMAYNETPQPSPPTLRRLNLRSSCLTMWPYRFHHQVVKLHSWSFWLTMRQYSFHHQVVKLHSRSSWLTMRPYSFHHQVRKLHSRSSWLTMRPYSFHHQVVKLYSRSS